MKRIQIENACNILKNREICASERAKIFRALNQLRFHTCLPSCYDLIFQYTGSQKYLPLQQSSIACASEPEKAEDFLKRTKSVLRRAHLSQKLQESMKKDSVSSFEITRLMNNQKISLSMIYASMQWNAEKIILHLFDQYSKNLFKFRPPEKWLFLICKYYDTAAAITAVQKIEERFPGIVKNSKDPWGNNLLWNTLYNDQWRNGKKTIFRLQKKLIELGCDPDEKNGIALSYNDILSTKNTP